MSCAANGDKREAVRRTWGADVPEDVPIFFFVGDVDCEGAVRLPCGDGYEDCAFKLRHMLDHLGDDFDNVFFCDDDTYVVPDRLLTSGHESHHYVGCPMHTTDAAGKPVIFAYGGSGYLLNREAVGAARKAADDFGTHFSDKWLGLAMDAARIPLTQDYRFCMGKRNREGFYKNIPYHILPNRFNRYITTHYATPELMGVIHRHFRHGLDLPENRYYADITVNGVTRSVEFREIDGDWWYLVENTGRAVGRFPFTNEAVLHAAASLCQNHD